MNKLFLAWMRNFCLLHSLCLVLLVYKAESDVQGHVPFSTLADAALSPGEFMLKGEVDHAKYLEKIAQLEKKLSVGVGSHVINHCITVPLYIW